MGFITREPVLSSHLRMRTADAGTRRPGGRRGAPGGFGAVGMGGFGGASAAAQRRERRRLRARRGGREPNGNRAGARDERQSRERRPSGCWSARRSSAGRSAGHGNGRFGQARRGCGRSARGRPTSPQGGGQGKSGQCGRRWPRSATGYAAQPHARTLSVSRESLKSIASPHLTRADAMKKQARCCACFHWPQVRKPAGFERKRQRNGIETVPKQPPTGLTFAFIPKNG